MIITAIHGQNHKGSTYNIASLLISSLGDNEVHEFFLPRDLDHFCTGCYRCIKDESECPFFKDKDRIMRSVLQSDLLIFTTPTYCLRASAPMKSFLDLTFSYWISHRPRKAMFSKKAVVISTAAGAGAKTAGKDITTALFYMGIPYIKTYCKAIQASCWDEVKPDRKEKIRNDMERLAGKIKSSKIRVGIRTRFFFSMMRMLQIKDMAAGEYDKRYWEEQGWLGKKRPWKV